LRNGLDYLQYQQYERALKFLRDAEAREKELSAAERQELKRGIEAAQSGLRAVADTSNRYALSERSRRRNGFTPAIPESEAVIAARPGSTGPAARDRANAGRDDIGGDTRSTAVASRRNTSRMASDEAPGEPIRLASVEATAAAPAPTGGPAPDASPAPAANAAPPIDPQSVTSEIPTLNAPALPNLTAVPSSPDAASGNQPQPTTPREGAKPQGANPEPMSRTDVLTTEPPPATRLQDPSANDLPAASGSNGASAGATTAQGAPAQDPPRDLAPPSSETGPASPALIPANAAPAPIVLETPDSATSPAAPASTPATTVAAESPAATAPAGAPAHRPAADAVAGQTSAPATAELVPTAIKEPAAPEASPAAPTGPSTSPAAEAVPPAATAPAATTDTEVAPLPALGADATRAAEVGGSPHRESEEPAATPAPASDGAVSPDPAAAPASAPGTDELPPLPGDLSRDGGATGVSAAPGAAAPTATPGAVAPAVEHTAPAATRSESAPADDPAGRAAPAPAPAQSTAPGGSTPPASGEGSLPQLPDDTAAGSRAGAALAPAPDPVTAPSGSPNSTAPADAGPAIPVGEVNRDATAAAPPTGPTGAAEERPIPVPQPDAATPTGSTPAPATADGTAPEPSPATGPAQGGASGSAEAIVSLPPRTAPLTQYTPEQARRIAELTPLQEREDQVRSQMRMQPRPESPTPREATSNLQTQTQNDIIRAPSPAEARPIKAIPVPEDWVPLAARNWTPQRKYWAAAATCHLPLYFQDPVLERYGHPVELFVGPVGRYLSYPVDDPNQSTQRNQIIQPLFSYGLFALQIAAWPYNAIMDPPWEAQYDLGYYRPGDVVPTDVYWLPLHGYGPPLRGNSY
jgi:hypothetical protein